MILTSVTDINPLQWSDLLAQSPTASFFQSPECYDFYASLSFLKPFVFGVSENEKLVGIMCGYIIADGNLIKQFFSRRAIVPGGLLLDSQISFNTLQQLLKFATQELSRKAIYLEIRNYNDYQQFRPMFNASGFEYQSHLNFHLPINNLEFALSSLKPNKRRYIKLSKKEGAEWEIAKTINDVKEFYELLRELYLTKVKTPLFPFEFFEKLLLCPSAKILLVRYQNKIVGGGVFVILSNKIIYEWFVCGEDRKYKNVYPSILATWAGIEYAVDNNLVQFDFMGAGKPGVEYGVRDFKAEFGGNLVEYGRFLFVCRPYLYSLGKYIVQKLKMRKSG